MTISTYDYDNGKSVFYENDSIKSISVGDGITALGEWLFQYCTEIQSASLPSTLTAIQHGAFYQLDTTIGATSIGATSGLTELTLPSSLKTIGKSAFAHNSLIEITIPASVTEWESYAFTDCSKLKKSDGGKCFDWCICFHTLLLAFGTRDFQELQIHW